MEKDSVCIQAYRCFCFLSSLSHIYPTLKLCDIIMWYHPLILMDAIFFRKKSMWQGERAQEFRTAWSKLGAVLTGVKKRLWLIILGNFSTREFKSHKERKKDFLYSSVSFAWMSRLWQLTKVNKELREKEVRLFCVVVQCGYLVLVWGLWIFYITGVSRLFFSF